MLAVIMLIVLGAALYFLGTLYDKRNERKWQETQEQIKRQRRHLKCKHCGMQKELH